MPGHNGTMSLLTCDRTDAFVLLDLGEGVPAVGQVRAAPKVLRDGAELLARSWTYTLATFEHRLGGASAGVNTTAEGRAEALSAFASELAPRAADGSLRLEPGRGVARNEVAALVDADDRSAIFWEHGASLRGLGAVLCADASGGLDGRAVTIEGFDDAGPELARAVYDRGARVVAVSSPAGAAVDTRGLAAPMLTQAWREHGPAFVDHLDVPRQEQSALWAQEVDVLFVGSRAGVVDHHVAAGLTLGRVVPTGPVPVTARALATLTRAGTVVLPDFVTTAGSLFAMRPGEGASLEGVRASASVGLLGAVGEVVAHPDGPFLAACRRAEAFLGSWRDELPFGRPLA